MKKMISITIDEDVLEKVKKIAADENRNLSNMIEFLIMEAIKEK